MRSRLAASALWLLVASAAPAASWRDHFAAARAAHDRRDFAGFRAELLSIADSIGEQPGVDYYLACAAAQLGERDEALRRLELYARSGLVRDLTADSDLASLRGDSTFARVAARVRANGDSIGSAGVLHRLSDPGLLAEDIAWDPAGRRVFVTSIHRGQVVEILSSGEERVWNEDPRPGWGVFAACVDPRRQRLWTSVAAIPTAQGYVEADSGRTGVVAWDLRTGRVVARIDWPPDGRPHVMGDLMVGPDGTVYVSDSRSGGVRTVRPGATSFTTLVPDGALGSPQTPALTANGRALYVPDYARGIVRLDLRTGALRWLTFEPGIALQGIDGLYRDGDGLIAVQNGTNPHRVMRFTLDAGGTRVVRGTPIESGTTRLGEPNHAVIAGTRLLFLANSGWDRVGSDQRLRDEQGTPPMILEVPLPAARGGR